MPRRIRRGNDGPPPVPCANDLLLPEEVEDAKLRADAEEFVRAAHDALAEVTRGTLYDLSGQPYESMPEVLREFQIRARMRMLRDLSRLDSVLYWADRYEAVTRAEEPPLWDNLGRRMSLYADVIEHFAQRADPHETPDNRTEPYDE